MAQSKVAPRRGGVCRVSSQQVLDLQMLGKEMGGGAGSKTSAAAPGNGAPAAAAAVAAAAGSLRTSVRAHSGGGKEEEKEVEEEVPEEGAQPRFTPLVMERVHAAAAMPHSSPSALLPSLPEYAATLSGVPYTSLNPLGDIDRASAVVEATPKAPLLQRGPQSSYPALPTSLPSTPAVTFPLGPLGGFGGGAEGKEAEALQVAAPASAASAEEEAKVDLASAPLALSLLGGGRGSGGGGSGSGGGGSNEGGDPVGVFLSPIRLPPPPTADLPAYTLAIAPRVEGRITMLPFNIRLASPAVCWQRGGVSGLAFPAHTLVWGGKEAPAFLALRLGSKEPLARICIAPARAGPLALGEGTMAAAPSTPRPSAPGPGTPRASATPMQHQMVMGSPLPPAGSSGAGATGLEVFRSPERVGRSGGGGGGSSSGGGPRPSNWLLDVALAVGGGASPSPPQARRRVLDSKGNETDEEEGGEAPTELDLPLSVRAPPASSSSSSSIALPWRRAWLAPSGEFVLGTLEGGEGRLVVAHFAGSGVPITFFHSPEAKWEGAAWAKDGRTLYVTDAGLSKCIRVRCFLRRAVLRLPPAFLHPLPLFFNTRSLHLRRPPPLADL